MGSMGMALVSWISVVLDPCFFCYLFHSYLDMLLKVFYLRDNLCFFCHCSLLYMGHPLAPICEDNKLNCTYTFITREGVVF